MDLFEEYGLTSKPAFTQEDLGFKAVLDARGDVIVSTPPVEWNGSAEKFKEDLNDILFWLDVNHKTYANTSLKPLESFEDEDDDFGPYVEFVIEELYLSGRFYDEDAAKGEDTIYVETEWEWSGTPQNLRDLISLAYTWVEENF